MTQVMSEIASASTEQMRGIDQVNNAVTAMDRVVQQNAGLVAEAAAATQNMADQADHLMQSVSRFKLHDEPAAAHPPAAEPVRVVADTTPRNSNPRLTHREGATRLVS